MTAIRVFFDEECYLCRLLAQFAQRHVGKGIVFSPNSELPMEAFGSSAQGGRTQEIVVEREGQFFAGAEAWEIMLGLFPDLKGLDWLIARLGMKKNVGVLLNRSTHIARRLCWKCRAS